MSDTMGKVRRMLTVIEKMLVEETDGSNSIEGMRVIIKLALACASSDLFLRSCVLHIYPFLVRWVGIADFMRGDNEVV